jgi:hypothetical protein
MATSGLGGNFRPLVVWIRRDVMAIVLFIALGLLILGPILGSPRTLVIGTSGDIYQHAYMTGWVAQALLLGIPPFLDPRLNFPAALYLTATDVPFLNLVAVAPATWGFGPTFGYNLMVLLAHVLSGYLMYLWVRNLTGSRVGGIVAGVIFLLAPYRILRSTGHSTLMSTYVLVLFFWALEHVLSVTQPKARQLVLLGFATFAVGLTSQYYLVICLITGAVYTLLRRLRMPWWLIREAGPMVLSIGCATLISSIPYFMAIGAGVYAHYDVQEDIRRWSLDPLNFITPAALHPLWGNFFQQVHPVGNVAEQTTYLGVIALALAAVGLALRSWRDFPVWTWAGVALVAAIFAIGTDLHLNGKAINETRPLWLPAYYLANLPLMNLVRVWSRFGVVTLLFVTVLAGLGAAALAMRSRRPALVGTVLVALVCIDFLPGTLPTMTVAPRPIDHWLANQPGDFAVAYLPPGEVVANYQNMYGSLFHGKHLPAFNHPEHRSPEYLDFQRRAHRFPDRDALNALRALHLHLLLIDRRAYDGVRWPAWETVKSILQSYPDVQIIGEQSGIVIVEFQ